MGLGFQVNSLGFRGTTLQLLRRPPRVLWGLGFKVLGGPWDLVSTDNWAYNPNYNPPK